MLILHIFLPYALEFRAIHSTLDYLIKEVQGLKSSTAAGTAGTAEGQAGRGVSVSPEPPGGYSRNRRVLKAMSKKQFKTFRI